MSPTLIWTLVVIAVLVVCAIGWAVFRRQRRQQLMKKFGPEYDRTVREVGSVRRAEVALEDRAKRVQQLHIRPLTAEDAASFAGAWRSVQARFVDDPAAAVSEADVLIGEVMRARGYPVADFEQRVADISVDHPDVVMNYRAAHEIAVEHEQGHASTEDLRQAMVHFHALFDKLLETAQPVHHEPAPEPEPAGRR